MSDSGIPSDSPCVDPEMDELAFRAARARQPTAEVVGLDQLKQQRTERYARAGVAGAVHELCSAPGISRGMVVPYVGRYMRGAPVSQPD